MEDIWLHTLVWAKRDSRDAGGPHRLYSLLFIPHSSPVAVLLFIHSISFGVVDRLRHFGVLLADRHCD